MDETHSAPTAQHRSTGFTELAAVHRDLVVITAGLSECGDPREGVHYTAVAEELRAWYDDSRISDGSVYDELRDIASRYDYLDTEDGGQFRITIDGIDAAEAHLLRVGSAWEDVNPWDDGTKVTIEKRQVAADYTGDKTP